MTGLAATIGTGLAVDAGTGFAIDAETALAVDAVTLPGSSAFGRRPLGSAADRSVRPPAAQSVSSNWSLNSSRYCSVSADSTMENSPFDSRMIASTSASDPPCFFRTADRSSDSVTR